MECEKCSESVEALYIKNRYNGNIDDGAYCAECYLDVHDEWFSDELEFQFKEGKNEFTRARGTEQ